MEKTRKQGKHCRARRYNDQMICDWCGLQWDVNDLDPPQCQSERYTKAKHHIDEIRGKLKL